MTDETSKPYEPAVGDPVCLRNGTVNMTVVGIDPKKGVLCAWHDRNGVAQSNTYPAAALVKQGY